MIIKSETEPITSDEFLIRLVWHDRFTDRVPCISPGSFDPRPKEKSGISFFREACLDYPLKALEVIDAAKRDRYGLVKLSVAWLAANGLSVRPDPVPQVPGHVVVPELNIDDFLADKARFTPIKLQLARAASDCIIRKPIVSQ